MTRPQDEEFSWKNIMRVYGKNPVLERLKTNPKSIRKICLQEGFSEASYVRKKAQKWGLQVFMVPKSKLLKIARNHNTQGILAEIGEYPYVPFDEVIDNTLRKKKCIIFIDGLNDPQNLGAIIRSVACLGNYAIVLPTHGSVSITEAVLRVASGGENYLEISLVKNLSNAIKQAKKEGFQIVGTTLKKGESLGAFKFPYPLGLVIGSEQKGVRDIIKRQLDYELTIPMAHDSIMFNVAVAAAVICYEITKQKNQK